MNIDGRLAPPHGQLEVVGDVPGRFAELVASEATSALAQGGAVDGTPTEPRFRLALSGGGTAEACYRALAARDDVPWGGVECYLGDERCVPADDADANQAMIRAALGDALDEVAAFHPMNCDDVAGYDALIGSEAPLDLIHLGLGPDGHTASLFPASAALDSPPGALVVHNVDPSGRNPHERLTLTFEAIAESRLAVFTVAGASKHDALHRVLTGEDLPAARITAARVVWLCDRDAIGEDLGRVR